MIAERQTDEQWQREVTEKVRKQVRQRHQINKNRVKNDFWNAVNNIEDPGDTQKVISSLNKVLYSNIAHMRSTHQKATHRQLDVSRKKSPEDEYVDRILKEYRQSQSGEQDPLPQIEISKEQTSFEESGSPLKDGTQGSAGKQAQPQSSMFGYLGPTNLNSSWESAQAGAKSFMTHSPMVDTKLGFQPSFNSIGSANTDKLFCIDEENNVPQQPAPVNALQKSTALQSKEMPPAAHPALTESAPLGIIGINKFEASNSESSQNKSLFGKASPSPSKNIFGMKSLDTSAKPEQKKAGMTVPPSLDSARFPSVNSMGKSSEFEPSPEPAKDSKDLKGTLKLFGANPTAQNNPIFGNSQEAGSKTVENVTNPLKSNPFTPAAKSQSPPPVFGSTKGPMFGDPVAHQQQEVGSKFQMFGKVNETPKVRQGKTQPPTSTSVGLFGVANKPEQSGGSAFFGARSPQGSLFGNQEVAKPSALIGLPPPTKNPFKDGGSKPGKTPSIFGSYDAVNSSLQK